GAVGDVGGREAQLGGHHRVARVAAGEGAVGECGAAAGPAGVPLVDLGRQQLGGGGEDDVVGLENLHEMVVVAAPHRHRGPVILLAGHLAPAPAAAAEGLVHHHEAGEEVVPLIGEHIDPGPQLGEAHGGGADGGD